MSGALVPGHPTRGIDKPENPCTLGHVGADADPARLSVKDSEWSR